MEIKPLGFLIMFVVIALVGLTVIEVVANSAAEMDETTGTATDEAILTDTSTPVTLSGTASSPNVTRKNQTWLSFVGTDGELVETSTYNWEFVENGNLTISGWVNFSSNPAPSVNKKLASVGALASSFPYHGITAGNGTVGDQNEVCAVFSGISTVRHYACSQSNLSINTWHHVASVFNGTHISLYVDGVLNSSFDVSGNSTYLPSTANFEVGDSGGNDYYYRGSADEYRMYNRTLQPSEISELYQSGRTPNASLPSEGLVMWLPLNEGSGTSIHLYNDTLIWETIINAITTATWQTDSADVTLTENTQYSISGNTFTLLDGNLSWSALEADYTYIGQSSSSATTILRITEILIGVSLIGICYLYIKSQIQ